MYAFDVEAINESVASVVRYIEKKHAVVRPLASANLIRAARLRAAGVRGDLTIVGLMRHALRKYFGENPLDVHVFVGHGVLGVPDESWFSGGPLLQCIE